MARQCQNGEKCLFVLGDGRMTEEQKGDGREICRCLEVSLSRASAGATTETQVGMDLGKENQQAHG